MQISPARKYIILFLWARAIGALMKITAVLLAKYIVMKTVYVALVVQIIIHLNRDRTISIHSFTLIMAEEVTNS